MDNKKTLKQIFLWRFEYLVKGQNGFPDEKKEKTFEASTDGEANDVVDNILNGNPRRKYIALYKLGAVAWFLVAQVPVMAYAVLYLIYKVYNLIS